MDALAEIILDSAAESLDEIKEVIDNIICDDALTVKEVQYYERVSKMLEITSQLATLICQEQSNQIDEEKFIDLFDEKILEYSKRKDNKILI